MRLTRIYLPTLPSIGETALVDACGSNHLLRVLRLKLTDALRVFDGQGHEYIAEIVAIEKHLAKIVLKQPITSTLESPLTIHLGQAISRGEKMDYTLQKAVELGVKTITPLFSERGGVKLSAERVDNKLDHWRKVVISACEQSGRSHLPEVMPAQALTSWLQSRAENCKLILHPGGEKSLRALAPPAGSACLLVGPEGGFSDSEVGLSQQFGFTCLALGPRILRTETAAPAAITALQCLWGDMG